MAYCSECGLQVAETDVFCPDCGISLKPAAAENEDALDMTKTVAINQADTLTPAQSSVSAAPEAAEKDSGKIEDHKSQTQADEASEADLQKKSEHQENPEHQASETEFSAESEKARNIVDDEIEEKNAAAASIEKTAISEAAEFDEKEEIKSLENAPSAAEDENVFSESEADWQEEISEDDSEDEFEDAQNEQKASSDLTGEDEKSFSEDGKLEDEVSSGLSDISEKTKSDESGRPSFPVENFTESDAGEPDETDSALDPAQNFIDDKSQNLTDEDQTTESQDEKFDFSPGEAAPIERPEDKLPEVPSSASVFDSVQIVQKDETGKPIAAENAPPLEEKPRQESRSYTSPNIGTGGNTDGKGSPKLKPLEEGTILNGRYEIVRKIGGGGMGAVYLASDKNLGGVLRAVKEMVQSYIEETQQEKAVSDFKRESMLLTSLDHPAIPTIYDYFYDEQAARFYLVMKYISGGDLASRLRSAGEGKIDEKTVAEWAVQIADVLDYLHNRQPPIVYRDLKPANVMVDGNTGRVMLIDFGIARWINKEEKGVTAVGTMGYAPPELFSGNVEPRSDIYSLGSTMFHLLTGADPQSNPLLIFDFQKNPHPRQINPKLSDQMEQILMRSVEYNAEKRFASAAELRQALEEHLENLKNGKVSYGVKQTPASVALSEEPVFCGFCGQRIIATDMFCAFCGAKQPLAQQGGVHPAGIYQPPSLTAKLMIVGTNELESPSFSLEKDSNLVGRRDPMSNIFPEVDLSKFDPQTKISRRHARIWREGASYMVEDLGSSNGTVLLPAINGTIRLTPHQPHVLTNGDKLKLGDTTMHFIVG